MSSPNRLRSAHYFYLKFIFDSFFSLTLYFEAPGLFACLVVNPVNAAILGNFVSRMEYFATENSTCFAGKLQMRWFCLKLFASLLKLSFSV